MSASLQGTGSERALARCKLLLVLPIFFFLSLSRLNPQLFFFACNPTQLGALTAKFSRLSAFFPPRVSPFHHEMAADPFAINQAMRQRLLGVVLGEFEKHVMDASSATRCLATIRRLHSQSYTYWVDSNWLRTLADMEAYDLIAYLVAYVSYNPFDLVRITQYMLLAGSPDQAIHQVVCSTLSATFGNIPPNHGYGRERSVATWTCLRDDVFTTAICINTVVVLQKAIDAIATLDPYIRDARWKDDELVRIIQAIQEMCAQEQTSAPALAHFNKKLLDEFHTICREGCEADACEWLANHMPSIHKARLESSSA